MAAPGPMTLEQHLDIAYPNTTAQDRAQDMMIQIVPTGNPNEIIYGNVYSFAGRTVVLSPAWRWSDGHHWASHDVLHEDIEDVVPGAPPSRTNLWQSLPPELKQLILQDPFGPLDADRRLIVHSQRVIYGSASADAEKAVDAHIGHRSDLAEVSRGFRTDVFAAAISLWRSTPTVPQIRCHVLDLDFTGAQALCAQFTPAQIMRINSLILPDQIPVIRLSFTSQPAASTVPVKYEIECIDSLPWDIRSLLAAGALLPKAELEHMAKVLNAMNDYDLLNMGSKVLGDDVIDIKRAMSKFT
ncbi:hypothetical protein B0A48_15410 [Cryoendolithus antarcticus]|uniref:Uncharacterized protein n=1 Tax=Cryoendolithus antarcticus TaxID=1507870 RepID=A0A1V8SHW8_9PEZI|nr:hypothetical protein B0A48_15410 [Cryoendolithus antarcticus]